jgi:trans-2,3-dihydro-3-hydroxyanthranilate isomerase
MGLSYHVVDVFAEKKYQGNQLADVHVDGALPEDLMLDITREMNYSETTFIESQDKENQVYRVRIFTQVGETPFAGHPTLGTAYVIQQTIAKKRVDTITLDLKVGKIPVEFTYRKGVPEVLWMRQLNPMFGKTHEPSTFAEFLGVDVDDIDQRYPIQEVSTGFPFFIVPLKNRKALEKSKLRKEPFLEYVSSTESKAPLIFCPEPRDKKNQLACRMFAPYFGVEEDPATGSANGCLAGYLARYRYFGSAHVDVRVEQGHEMGRPSLLYLRSDDLDDHVEVSVGGKCVMVAKGVLV